jgi:WD40 repeat protein
MVSDMSSSTPDEHSNAEASQSDTAFVAKMRAGVRGSVDRIHGALANAAYPTLTALICSSACTPIVAAALGSGATMMAAVGALGAVGGNAISDLVNTRLSQLRSDDATPDRADLEAALTELFTEVLQSDSPEMDEARNGVANLLRRTDSFEIVIREALQEGHRDLLAALQPEIEALAGANRETRSLLIDQRELLLNLCRDQGQSLEIQLATRDEVQEVLGVLVHMFQFLQGLAEVSTFDPGSGGARWAGTPYLGLQPFTAKDAPIFFGRTVALAELVTRAKTCVAAGSMVVTGPSGVGKSSLLRAGLLPAVENGMLREDGDQGPWRSILLEKPGEDPLRSLAVELAKHGGRDSGETYRSLNAHPEEAGDRVEERRTGRDGERPERMLLVVDQFEEVFTLAGDDQRDAFLRALEAISESPNAFVALGIRSDYVDRCMSEPTLREVVQERLFRVGPMTREQMRQAAALPAAAAGIRIEERVLATLLDEIYGSGDAPRTPDAALPLLSQTMLLLWEQGHSDRRLTYDEYVAIGGVENAVRTAAERAFGKLGPVEQREAERFFRRLVGVKSNGRLVRLSLNRNELDDAQLPVCEAFLAERLLVADDSTIEISHDVLLEQWTRLRAWLEPDLDSRVLFTQVEEDAAEWEERGKDTSFLYQGARLAAVESGGVSVWETRPEWGLSPSERAATFLQLSRDRQVRRVRLRRVLTGTLAGITALALLLSALAYVQNQDLTEQRNQALSQQLAAESAALRGVDGALAQLLAAAAWRLDDTDEAFKALAQAVGDQSAGHATGVGQVSTMAFSPDGNLLATRAYGGALALWSTDTWTFEELAAGDEIQSDPNDLKFSPDGSRLAAAMESGLLIWNLDTLEQETTPIQGNVEHVAFSPDGSMLAFAQDDRVSLWDLRTGAEEASLPAVGTALAFSADGTTLYMGGYDSDTTSVLQQWDLASLELLADHSIDGYAPDSIQVSAADSGRVLACNLEACFTLDDNGSLEPLTNPLEGNPMAISGDGTMIAGTTDAGDIVAWEATAGEQVYQFPTASYTSSMAFQPGSSILAVGSSSGIQRWDLDRAPVRSTMLVSSNDGYSVNYVSISDDGRRALVTGSYDHTAIVDLPATADGEPIVTVKERDLWDGRLSPDGTISAGFSDERLEVANIETGESVAGMDNPNFTDLEFNPNGDMLAIGVYIAEEGDTEANHATNEVWLWDYEADEVRTRITGLGLDVWLSFSPDGALLATGDYTGQVSVWNTDDGSLVTRFADVGVPLYLKFSSDGSRLGFATPAGLALLDLDSGEQRQLNTGPLTGEFDFSPNDRYITYPNDTGMNLWSLERDQLAAELPVEHGADFGIFVPHSWQILVGDGDDVRLIDAGFLDDPYAAVCNQAGRSLTEDEWETYLPDFEFEEFEVCP